MANIPYTLPHIFINLVVTNLQCESTAWPQYLLVSPTPMYPYITHTALYILCHLTEVSIITINLPNWTMDCYVQVMWSMKPLRYLLSEWLRLNHRHDDSNLNLKPRPNSVVSEPPPIPETLQPSNQCLETRLAISILMYPPPASSWQPTNHQAANFKPFPNLTPNSKPSFGPSSSTRLSVPSPLDYQ